MSTLTDWATAILAEADAYQVSNADCDWDDVEDTFADWEEDERPTADEWYEAKMKDRLWAYGLGDQRLDAVSMVLRQLVHEAVDPTGHGCTDDALRAATEATVAYLTSDYCDLDELPTIEGKLA